MGQLSGNSCNIVTVFPLGLDCDSINASLPDSANGYLALYITGGTPPYNVSWSNGSQGTYLTNLTPGNYTATVTDYYGDFTATTTCSVGYESFYLEKFEKCSGGEIIYYVASTPSLFVPNKIYKLTTQTRCWESLGIEINTGQTYINAVAVKSAGPYLNCNLCQPTLPPIQIYRGPLCLTRVVHPATVIQTTYLSGNTINNYPSWTSNTQTIYYNTGTTRWTISGWTNPNAPYLQSPSTPPVGGWTIPGTVLGSINVQTGTCTTSSLNISVQTQNPACSTNTGSATITVFGGTPPYQYSLNNINFSSSNIFTNLTPGFKTVYVKDSSSPQNNGNQTFAIIPQQTFTNYSLNLNFVEQGPLSNTVNQTASFATFDKNSTFTISLSPQTQFSQPTTVQFDLLFDIATTAYTNSVNQPIITNNINVTGTTGTTVGSNTSTVPVTQTTPGIVICGGDIIITTYRITYTNCQLTDINASIGGTINQFISEVCSSNNFCVLKAYSDVTLSIRQISLTPLDCQGINTTIISRTTHAEKVGPVCPLSS